MRNYDLDFAPLRLPAAKKLLGHINKTFGTLAFCRWVWGCRRQGGGSPVAVTACACSCVRARSDRVCEDGSLRFATYQYPPPPLPLPQALAGAARRRIRHHPRQQRQAGALPGRAEGPLRRAAGKRVPAPCGHQGQLHRAVRAHPAAAPYGRGGAEPRGRLLEIATTIHVEVDYASTTARV